jgi:hypothetical protein
MFFHVDTSSMNIMPFLGVRKNGGRSKHIREAMIRCRPWQRVLDVLDEFGAVAGHDNLLLSERLTGK